MLSSLVRGGLGFSLATVVLLAPTQSAHAQITSMADGLWTDASIWFFNDGDDNFTPAGRAPDQSLNGGTGELVIIASDVTVPSGVDYVASDTIDFFGNPQNNNRLDIEGGNTLTIQEGARVGSQLHMNVVGAGAATIEVEGEFVSSGINNADSIEFNINVRPGATMTFDTVAPAFPSSGNQQGNVFAGAGSIDVNIEGRLNAANIVNANAGGGATYTLINGGVLDMWGKPGSAGGSVAGIQSDPGTRPLSSVDREQAVQVVGSGAVSNLWNIDPFWNWNNFLDGMTIDISDQSALGTDDAAWANYVIDVLDEDPFLIPGPMNFQVSSGSSSDIAGTGTVQFDVYAFQVDDMGTPADPSDDAITGVFEDRIIGGPSTTSNSNLSFDGTFEIDYIGPVITDDLLGLLPGTLVDLMNGVANASDYSAFETQVSIPDQIWDDGERQFLVEFSDPTTFGANSTADLLGTFIESISVLSDSIPGDANGDGRVDLLDLDILGQNFGMPTSNGSDDGDFNDDGFIDLLDLDILGQNFGSGTSESFSVPEPVSLISLQAGLFVFSCLSNRQRRR